MDVRKEDEPTPMKSRTTVERKSERELVITRTVNGPARLVFQAWTTPELVKKWWTPRSAPMKLVTCEIDLRPGGRYRYVFDWEGHPSFEAFGKFIEVTPPSRIVWTNDEQPTGEQAVSTVTFEEKAGKTLVSMTEVYPTKEALEAALASGAMEGTRETFDQLDEFIDGLAASPS